MSKQPRKQTNYLPTSLDEMRVAVSVYVLKRVAAELPGLPATSKNANVVAMERLGRETGIPYRELYKIMPHIEALKDKSGLEDPKAKLRQEAINAIRAHYADQPIPGSANGFSFDLLEIVTGYGTRILRSPECAKVIAELADKNGRAPEAEDYAAELAAALNRYREQLLSSVTAPPWNSLYGKPDYPAISRATRIPVRRLRGHRFKAAIEQLFAAFPPPKTDLLSDQIDRLARFIDQAIASGRRLPVSARGIQYKLIGEELGIAPHLLIQNKEMARLIRLWRDAFVDAADPVHASLDAA